MESKDQQNNQENPHEDMENSDSDGQQEQDEAEVVIPPEEPKILTFNKTSVLMARSHDDKTAEDECSYCFGKRTVDDPMTGEENIEEKDIKYHKIGFTCTKMRVDDFEHCINMGFTRCGTYIYQRNSYKSCCEVWQYRVDIDEFQMSASQKKVIKKFHKYLNYGTIHGPEGEEEKKSEEQNQVPDEREIIISKTKKIVEDKFISLVDSDELKKLVQEKHKISVAPKECLTTNLFSICQHSGMSEEDVEKLFEKCEQEFKQLLEQNAGNQEYSHIKQFEFLKQTVGSAQKQKTLRYFNIKLVDSKVLKKQTVTNNKKSNKQQKTEEPSKAADPKYTQFQEYLLPKIPYVPVAQPKHHYTIEVHKGVFTEELFGVYEKYEQAVHKKERDPEQLKRFFCSSPLYNPDDPKDHDRIGMAAPINYEKVDEGRVYNEGGDGIYPGKGSYHFYHRIDGRLVAVGNIDLSTTILNSQYFIYDPEFQFLCMGVIGAIHEIEYMKMIQKTFNCEIKYYQLGELVLNCPKVNYKLNYKPGLLICPRTKQLVKYEDVKSRVLNYSRMPIQFKRDNLKHCQLVDFPTDQLTVNEHLAVALQDQITQIPFLYENTRYLQVECLQQGGKDHCVPLILQMIEHLGLDCVRGMLLELKFEKKPEPKKEEPEKKEDEQKQETMEEDQNDQNQQESVADGQQNQSQQQQEQQPEEQQPSDDLPTG